MARPSKLNKERREKIASLIRAGNYSSQAAQASGISERTFFRWMEQGAELSDRCEEWIESVDHWNGLSDDERRKTPDLEPKEDQQPTEEEWEIWQFWRDIKKAEAEAEAAAVLLVKQAAQSGSWQAAAWYLERKFKDRWSRQDKTVHEGSIAHAHQHQLLSTSPEQIEAARARLEAARTHSRGSQAPQLPPSSDQNGPEIEAEIVDEAEKEES